MPKISDVFGQTFGPDMVTIITITITTTTYLMEIITTVERKRKPMNMTN